MISSAFTHSLPVAVYPAVHTQPSLVASRHRLAEDGDARESSGPSDAELDEDDDEMLDRPRILVVEDQPNEARALRRVLIKAGYHATVCETGRAAIDRALCDPPALVLLDLGLPDVDGIEVCRSLRKRNFRQGILVHSGRTDLPHRIQSFEAGADDYLAKPSEPSELIWKIKALLRRTPPPGPRLELRLRERIAVVGGEERGLTPMLAHILHVLAENHGNPVTREQLTRSRSTHTVDSHMLRLRNLLGPAATYIKTVPRAGFRLTLAKEHIDILREAGPKDPDAS
jgi:DNA-binding response OmpR family regulator